MKEDATFRTVSLIVDYVFGKGVSSSLPQEGYDLVYSRTGRIKQIYHDKKLFATVRPNGTLALTAYSAGMLLKSREFMEHCVFVKNDAVEFIKKGLSVFNKFVVRAGKEIQPESEVAVLDEDGNLIALGTAVINGIHMGEFKSGVAVKVRKSVK